MVHTSIHHKMTKLGGNPILRHDKLPAGLPHEIFMHLQHDCKQKIRKTSPPPHIRTKVWGIDILVPHLNKLCTVIWPPKPNTARDESKSWFTCHPKPVKVHKQPHP